MPDVVRNPVGEMPNTNASAPPETESSSAMWIAAAVGAAAALMVGVLVMSSLDDADLAPVDEVGAGAALARVAGGDRLDPPALAVGGEDAEVDVAPARRRAALRERVLPGHPPTLVAAEDHRTVGQGSGGDLDGLALGLEGGGVELHVRPGGRLDAVAPGDSHGAVGASGELRTAGEPLVAVGDHLSGDRRGPVEGGQLDALRVALELGVVVAVA